MAEAKAKRRDAKIKREEALAKQLGELLAALQAVAPAPPASRSEEVALLLSTLAKCHRLRPALLPLLLPILSDPGDEEGDPP